MQPTVKAFDSEEEPSEIAGALRADGVAVVHDAVPVETIDAIANKLRIMFERQTPAGAEFYGANTRRLVFADVLRNVPEVAEALLVNSKVLEIADSILLPQAPWALAKPDAEPVVAWEDGVADALESYRNLSPRDPIYGPNCHHYRLSVAGVSQTCRGDTHQFLHREMDIYRPFFEHDPKNPEHNMAVAFAITDFTKENGATRVVPGSHLWSRDREAKESEVVQAVMPKGSVAIWSGKTLHGLAASCDESRMTVIFTMTANWLTPEENYAIGIPPDLSRSLPKRAQQMIGYRASHSLGWVTGRDPDNLLNEIA